MESLDEKCEELRHFINKEGKERGIIVFSGGIDSSTLTAICYEVLGVRGIAVSAKPQTYPRGELEEAKR